MVEISRFNVGTQFIGKKESKTRNENTTKTSVPKIISNVGKKVFVPAAIALSSLGITGCYQDDYLGDNEANVNPEVVYAADNSIKNTAAQQMIEKLGEPDTAFQNKLNKLPVWERFDSITKDLGIDPVSVEHDYIYFKEKETIYNIPDSTGNINSYYKYSYPHSGNLDFFRVVNCDSTGMPTTYDDNKNQCVYAGKKGALVFSPSENALRKDADPDTLESKYLDPKHIIDIQTNTADDSKIVPHSPGVYTVYKYNNEGRYKNLWEPHAIIKKQNDGLDYITPDKTTHLKLR